jgi:hypothetical protein
MIDDSSIHTGRNRFWFPTPVPGKEASILVNTPAQTLSVPEAGREYYGLGRNGSYAAAKRGDIPTIRIGKLLRVPVRALEQQLDAALKPDAA